MKFADGLMAANERFYSLLSQGMSVTEFMQNGKKHQPTVALIDWDNLGSESLGSLRGSGGAFQPELTPPDARSRLLCQWPAVGSNRSKAGRLGPEGKAIPTRASATICIINAQMKSPRFSPMRSYCCRSASTTAAMAPP